ncbi:ferrous iron transport protein B [Feifania hominis]|uniref:Ferrous iron transport protein B n=1 Tax=Feifania hominis TaxID=2763660 RepID=A0A926DEY5_9FIRM|nr:ferrous iron transport protein B [Feifania hominis]MBC8536956.1 ferrous iron transport protein B [Feifania hominis]
MVFALIGNQNCGKTTLFNQLTGSNQHVGNFPGVTVEKKEGRVRKHRDVTIVDLPGIYSLSPYTSEEVVTRDFLTVDRPDGIINIVDATNIERNLYLTLQLMELGIPMVVALNMMDEVRASGGTIDIEKLQAELQIPVVPIAAYKNEGVGELVERAIKVGEEHIAPKKVDFCTGPVHKAIHSIAHIVEEKARQKQIPVRFAATKLVESDEPMIRALALTQNELDILGHVTEEMEQELGTDREAALADMRYEFIEKLVADCVIKPTQSKEQIRSEKIDNILTHKVFAIPIFLLIMLTTFWLTFNVIGARLSALLSVAIDSLTGLTSRALEAAGVSTWMHSLLIDGVFAGVGSVLSFLPTIVVLFFFLSLLEDSGYMARVAFVMDKLLRRIGLSGRSFVPMLIGFGCSVPAIMSTRTLSSERDRKMTIMLTPFMSCSAKMPIYAVFTAAFFPRYQAFVMIGLYVTGIVVAILVGLLLKSTLFRGNPVPFVMELPVYRLPSPKSVVIHMWEKAKDFLVKAFTIIFMATIVVWFLSNLDFRFNLVTDNSKSMLASLGRLIAPIFEPLGFGDWRASTALITGLTAKETVVSTLAILTGAGDSAHLIPLLGEIFTPMAAFSFLVFTLLYMPCVAAMAAVRREMGSSLSAAMMMAFQTCVAWLVALCVYQTGSAWIARGLTFGPADALLAALLISLVVLAHSFLKRRRKKGGCGAGCAGCTGGCASCDKASDCENIRK